MKRIIKKVVILAVGVFLSINLLNSFFFHFLIKNVYSDGSYNWVDKVSPRILIMGSSSVLYGLSPGVITQELNLPEGSVVVLAKNGRTPASNYFLYKSIEKDLDKAEAIFYGLDPHFFSRHYFETDNLFPADWSLTERCKIIREDKDAKLLAFFGGDLKTNAEAFFDNMGHRDAPVPPDFGAKVIKRKMTRQPFKVQEPFAYGKFDISVEYISYLKMLKESAEKSGKKFILYLAPASYSWTSAYKDSCAYFDKEFYTAMNKYLGPVALAGGFSQIPVEHEDSCFSDIHHLNESGQKELSIKFAHELPGYMELKPAFMHALYAY